MEEAFIVQYKTKDGKIFESADQAREWIKQRKEKEKQYEINIEKIKIKQEELRDLTINEYEMKAKDKIACNCPIGKDYSVHCLIHFCTCQLETEFQGAEYDKLICPYHTNEKFKNKGCFWCRHSDCGKWYC